MQTETDTDELKIQLRDQLTALFDTAGLADWGGTIKMAYTVAHTARQLELNELRREQEVRFQDAMVLR